MRIIPKQDSICILAHTFCMDSSGDFEEFRSTLELLREKKLSKGVGIVDQFRYYPFVFNNNGILNIDAKNIYQFEIGYFEKKIFEGIENIQEKDIYLDEEMQSEVVFSSIKWIFVLDTKYRMGLLFYQIDLKTRSVNCLETLSKNKIFRYLRDKKNNNLNKLRVFENKSLIGDLSFYSILKECFGSYCDRLIFLEEKPLQFHFFNKIIFGIQENRDLNCYKLLRILGSSNNDVERKDLYKKTGYEYNDPSIYAFVLNEGLVLTAREKTPLQLVKTHLATQIIFLYHRRFEHIVASFMKNNISYSNGMASSYIKGLNEIRRDWNISNFYVNLPISQYSEIQEVYNLTKLNSGLNQATLKEAFGEAATFLMEEVDEARMERERQISLFLGVIGITGLISFIFDYLFISKNKKFIETIDFPFNTLPFLLFLLTFILIFKFLNKK